MIHLYLDESGDLGFDLVNRKSSRHFTIVILRINDDASRLILSRAIRRTIRKKLNPKGKRNRWVAELKGTATTLEVKQYFFRQTQPASFSISAITLNKRRVYDDLVRDKSRIYNWLARLLLEKVVSQSEQNAVINLVLDRSKSKHEIHEFNQYIINQTKGLIDPKTPLYIHHRDSREDPCLSAADLFAWGVFRLHERKDAAWYNIFKTRIAYETTYLPDK